MMHLIQQIATASFGATQPQMPCKDTFLWRLDKMQLRDAAQVAHDTGLFTPPAHRKTHLFH